MRSLLRRRPSNRGKELAQYRAELRAHTTRVDTALREASDTIEALRQRALDPEEAVGRLGSFEDELDAASEDLAGMLAPADLHGLHMEYEASLQRALRGIVTVERGCGITRLPHRPPEDEEPFTYYKRGHLNVQHARMRMEEVVDVLLAWEPGRPTEATVAGRLRREVEGSEGR